jgi:hypothetical protein
MAAAAAVRVQSTPHSGGIPHEISWHKPLWGKLRSEPEREKKKEKKRRRRIKDVNKRKRWS